MATQTNQPMSEEIKKEHIKGKYGIAQTSITAVVTLLAAIITGVVAYRVGVMQVNSESVQSNIEAEDRITALEEKLASLRDEVSVLEEDNKKLQSEYEAVQKDNAKLQGDNATLQADYDAAQSEIADLRSQLDAPLSKQLDNKNTSSENDSGASADSENITQTVNSDIPEDAVNYNGHAYKAYSNSFTWTNAKLFCESLGGHLVTITDIQESVFLCNYLGEIESTKYLYWIGLYRKKADQNWTWITGETFQFSNWRGSGPYYDSTDTRVALHGKNYKNAYLGEWCTATERDSEYGLTTFEFTAIGLICEWDTT